MIKYKETKETRNVNFGGNIGTRATDVYAQIWYLERSVTVSYDTDGGSAVNPETVVQGNTVTEPTTTKNHATFDGWYTDKTYQTKWNFNEPVNEDMTLYAKWVENETPVSPDKPSTPEQPDKPENPTVPEKPSNENKGSTEETVKPNTEKKEEAKVTSTNKTKKESKKVKTGDQTNILYFMLLTVVSLLMVLILIRQRFKKSFK